MLGPAGFDRSEFSLHYLERCGSDIWDRNKSSRGGGGGGVKQNLANFGYIFGKESEKNNMERKC